jgi:hypothetical protein
MDAYQSLRQASIILRRADVGLRQIVAAPASRVPLSRSVSGGQTFGGHGEIALAVLGWRRTISVVAHGPKSTTPANRLLQTARTIWGPGIVPRAGSVFGFRRFYQHGSNSFHESSARLMCCELLCILFVCLTASHRAPPRATASHLAAPRRNSLHCIRCAAFARSPGGRVRRQEGCCARLSSIF